MDSIRSKGQQIREEWVTSFEPVRRTKENRFRKMTLMDQLVQIIRPMEDNEIDYLSRHIETMFPNVERAKLVKSQEEARRVFTTLKIDIRQRVLSVINPEKSVARVN